MGKHYEGAYFGIGDETVIPEPAGNEIVRGTRCRGGLVLRNANCWLMRNKVYCNEVRLSTDGTYILFHEGECKVRRFKPENFRQRKKRAS